MRECSIAWGGLPAWGSATQASFFVALEQSGPWGREALTESHLDPGLGAALADAAARAGGRVLLIRRPGRHADIHEGPRRVYVAGGLASAPWLLGGALSEPADLLGLPWGTLGGSMVPEVAGLTPTGPVLLVCTNAKRDRCCALRGRPIALALAEAGRAVWECSHTGGHRFAPTGVVLPLGQVVGRLTVPLGAAVLDAAASGRLAPQALGETHDRGMSHLEPRLAAAVSFVAASVPETDPHALRAEAGSSAVVVRHRDGRQWSLAVTETSGEPLPDSCGKPPRPSRTWRVEPGAAQETL